MEKTLTTIEKRRVRGIAIALLALLSLPALSNTTGGQEGAESGDLLFPEQSTLR